MCEDSLRNAKMAAEQQYPDGGCAKAPTPQSYYSDTCNQAQTYRPPTLREEAEKRVGHHRDQAEKADQAVAFLRENPAFDEFVRLVRAGVIQF